MNYSIRVRLIVLAIIAIQTTTLFSQVTEGQIKSFLEASYNGRRAFQNQDFQDLEISSQHLSSVSNVRHAYFHQRFQGINIHQTVSSVHYQTNGKLVHHNLGFLPSIESSIVSIVPNQILTAEGALQKISEQLNYSYSGPFKIKDQSSDADKAAKIEKSQVSLNDIPVNLIYYTEYNYKFVHTQNPAAKPFENRKIKLGWELYIEEPNQINYWHIIVDAISGAIVFKENLVISCEFENHESEDHSAVNGYKMVSNEAKEEIPFTVSNASSSMMVGGYRVFPMPLESAGHGSRSLVNNPDNALASPFGWHDTNGAAGAEFTITRGNNTHAYEDGNNSGFSPNGGGGLVFDFAFNPVYTMGVDESESAIITNLFYWTNIIHDVVYQYGFTETAGNFQVNNYGRGGVGADDVMAEAQDGSGTCNANFGTPPDGSRPRMQMYVCGSRDGDVDNGVIVHEYAHGISNRLTGGPANVGCLGNQEQMGEGWSDWYALMLTMESGDAGTDARGIGTWLFNQAPNGPGIRPYPYSTSLAVNPHTYDAIKTAAVPHGVGSVWCAMLWELTWKLVDKYGFSTDFYNGSAGNNIAMRLVTEAMKLQPCSPGFVDGRNAILKADTILYGAANACEIWCSFAKRGLGLSASQGSSGSRSDGVEAFNIPVICEAAAPTTTCFEFSGSIENWVVPAGVTSVTIEAKGAQGGSNEDCPGLGGLGAIMKGTFTVTPGQTLKILVGQQGGNGRSGSGNGGGGGGGSFVSTSANVPMIVAGGGGGSQSEFCGTTTNVNIDANLGQAGFDGYSDLGGSPDLYGVGGTPGNGATNSIFGGPASGNGGGFYTDGEVCQFGFPGGQAFVNGGAGTVYSWDPGFGDGGFGGGSCCDNWGGGGAGGYSGGGGSWHAPTNGGGGGSYNAGTGQMASLGNMGNGQICITYSAVATGEPMITCPVDVTVTCSSAVPPVNIAAPTVTPGACTIAGLTVSHIDDIRSNQTCVNRFVVTRRYRVVDACGLADTCSQTITVNDNVVPTARCRNITVNLDANGNATITASQINNGSTDNCTATANLIVSAAPSVLTCSNIGVNNVTLSVRDECANVGTCIASVTVVDAMPPTFMPGCPAKNISLNAGPGECEVSWDAPVFMAMDNCPAGQYFGAINRVTNICRTNAAWQISGGAGAWGVMFDLVNTSGGQLNLQEVGWLSFANVTHNIYYKTTPGGHASVQATPSAWTLCASRVARRAGFNGPKDTFNLVTATVYDTLKKCSPILVDSTKLGCLTMAAGETRGVYIHAPGQASAYLSIFGDCTTGVFGDANVNTPVNGATYTGGLFTAPFVNSSFGFGN
ncbi:MAG TPA: M36 family metallopeptidase, partial [Saprospiraceae bacterium]|nr:M36 family metallopeptidase [Saprospiraceae bacterium]